MLAVPASYAGHACGNQQACGGAKAIGKPQPCSGKAAEGLCNNGAWKKLGRGLCNMVTFPLELPNQISRTNNSDGPMAAFTWGLVKGAGMTCFRALVGVYETLTFPIPCPEGYKPVLTDPEFFLEDQIC
jgi:putative exosortase-associated protein (TIGR04073 family)